MSDDSPRQLERLLQEAREAAVRYDTESLERLIAEITARTEEPGDLVPDPQHLQEVREQADNLRRTCGFFASCLGQILEGVAMQAGSQNAYKKGGAPSPAEAPGVIVRRYG